MMNCRGYDSDNDGIDTANNMEQPIRYPTKDIPIRKANFIPLRLSMKQRKSQRLVRAITLASSYTDKVDIDFDKSAKREHAIVKEVLGAMRGLIVALDLKQGAELMNESDFGPFQKDIVDSIEYARRYKIANPDLLRQDYVKFLYMLQDAVFSEGVKEALGFSISDPILTVGSQLEKLGCADLLEDPRLPLAITPVPRIKDFRQLNTALRYKDRLVSTLCKFYASKANVSAEEIEVCVRSLNDANNFDDDNADSAGELLEIFKHFFAPDEKPSAEYDLSIVEGREGSRLTHEHKRQYYYVVQSLSLWRLITRDMFRLWKLAEDDMLNPENPYEYRTTGQGKQRVQPAPNLFKAVKEILEMAKAELGEWVGSERIHMGDNQVPNAFFFIEKYAQISRIIVPILRTVRFIERRYKGEDLASANENAKPNRVDVVAFQKYVDSVYGSVEKAQLTVLRDFFRHAFDGSGGLNDDEAGSCIDGRLTSAWNWCNKISAKPYYPLFLLSGFQTFDGDLTL